MDTAYGESINTGIANSVQGPSRGVRVLPNLLLATAVLVGVAHFPVLSSKSMYIDDGQYLEANVLVQNPSWNSVKRFFTEVLEPSTVRGYYQPLTMTSLMFDVALGGRAHRLEPFHRTNLLLHICNTILVAVLLYQLFGNVWGAVAAGLIFGFHPMTVESIAWISERKTLLASFFALLSLVCHLRFVRRGHLGFYLGSLLSYLLALIAKPTALPLPLLILLLDYWPLQRIGRHAVKCIAPFMAVAGLAAAIIVASQARTASVEWPQEQGLFRVPLVISHNLVFYLQHMIWPIDLTPYHPFPEPMSLAHPAVMWGVVGTGILAGFLLISLRWTPAFFVGGMFFFLAILPTMQIIGFTPLIASDKYAYLPSLGLLITLAWILRRLFKSDTPIGWPIVPWALLFCLVVGAEFTATRHYIGQWRDTSTLYEHMLALNPGDGRLHSGLGDAFSDQGRTEDGMHQYRLALAQDPNNWRVCNNLGLAFKGQGKNREAADYYQRAISINRHCFEANYNLARVMLELDQSKEGIEHYKQALEIKPDSLMALIELSWLLATHSDATMRESETALQLAKRVLTLTSKRNPESLDLLAATYAADNRFEQAIETANRALEMATKRRMTELSNMIRTRLGYYRNQRPYIQQGHHSDAF